METTIVCGVLGSGKTTFIQNILKDSKEKTVVLVNDFGKTGIDGEILSVDGIEAIELPSGCVCCTLKFDLITTIEKVIKEFKPDHLYIEPSGVASPSGVLDALDSLKIGPALVVGIIDAAEFIEIHESEMYGSFFEDQIINSDIILINKTDLVDKEKVDRTKDILTIMNERAVLIPTVNAVLGKILPDIAYKEKTVQEHHHSLNVDTLSFLLNETLELYDIEKLFSDLQDGIYGNIMRAKALVQTDRGPFRFDLSSGQVVINPFNKDITENRLVVIGANLNGDLLEKVIQP
jgi:G3E family GTPase